MSILPPLFNSNRAPPTQVQLDVAFHTRISSFETYTTLSNYCNQVTPRSSPLYMREYDTLSKSAVWTTYCEDKDGKAQFGLVCSNFGGLLDCDAGNAHDIRSGACKAVLGWEWNGTGRDVEGDLTVFGCVKDGEKVTVGCGGGKVERKEFEGKEVSVMKYSGCKKVQDKGEKVEDKEEKWKKGYKVEKAEDEE